MTYEFTKWPADPHKQTGGDAGSLCELLLHLAPSEPFQLWIDQETGEYASVYANEERARLEIQPPGRHLCISTDPDYHGPKDAIEFICLENGMLDDFLRSDCVPRDAGLAAVLHYIQTGARAPFITWFPE